MQICFWDPRSDDDQVQVTCVQFYNDELLVGFKGGLLLLFRLNNQSSTVTIPLHRVSILRDDPRQKGRNWQSPMELRLDGIECDPGYQPIFCVGIFPNIPVTTIGFAKEQKLWVKMMCVWCVEQRIFLWPLLPAFLWRQGKHLLQTANYTVYYQLVNVHTYHWSS